MAKNDNVVSVEVYNLETDEGSIQVFRSTYKKADSVFMSATKDAARSIDKVKKEKKKDNLKS